MSARKIRATGTAWGSYTIEQADIYYEKLGIECATKEQYRNWFMKAERANTPCRRLIHYCSDCLLSYRLKMVEQDRCVAEKLKRKQQLVQIQGLSGKPGPSSE